MASCRKEYQFLLVGWITLFALSVYIAVLSLMIVMPREGQGFPTLSSSSTGEVFVITCLILVSAVCRDIAHNKPSDYLPYKQVLVRYLKLKALCFLGWRGYRKLRQASRGVEAAQREWLMRAVQRRKGTAFGKDHQFDTIRTVEDFRHKVPVVGYDYYRPYAERAAAGESNVLVPDDIIYVILTSGTTGRNKMFPISKPETFEFVKSSLALPIYFNRTLDARSFTLKKQLQSWVLASVVRHEKSGLRMGAASGLGTFDPGCCTPFYALQEIRDEATIMYIHAVFALLHDDLDRIELLFLGRSFFLTLETHWREITEDIRTGTLNSDLDVTADMRSKINKDLWANPARARELHSEFSKGFDNIIPRIWPHVHHIAMRSSGTLQSPSLTLQKRYFPDIPVYSSVHNASEGLYGVCMNPGDIMATYYTMMPHLAFYEFIPFDDLAEPSPRTKLMHELEVNEKYELCMTTLRGLSRYRTGDVIRIVSYFNEIPQYEFVGRYGVILNVCNEKTTEIAFNSALGETMAQLDKDFQLVDYTTADSDSLDNIQAPSEGERSYILFIEVESSSNDILLNDKQKQKFDHNLQIYNENYKTFREQGRIQQMVVIQTRPGAFTLLKDHLLAANPRATGTQYKTPRLLRKEADLRLMLEQAAQPWNNLLPNSYK